MIHAFAAYSHFGAHHFPSWPIPGDCAGSESAAIFGCGLLSSYLGLFINFYIQTYKAPKAPKGKRANGVANGNGFVTFLVCSFTDHADSLHIAKRTRYPLLP